MKWKFITNSGVALALALGLVLAQDPPQAPTRSGSRTLDELTRTLETVTRTDGVTVTKRVFSEWIPFDEYLAAVAIESAVDSTPLTLMTTGVCIPPDQDYDGDGFVGAEDVFPLHNGEYVADRPRVGAQFTSYIDPGIDVLYDGHTEITTETEHYLREELTYKERVKDAIEIHEKFNQSVGIKLAFGLAKLVPSFSFDLDYASTWSLERQHDYEWVRERARETEERFLVIRKGVESGTIDIEAEAGYVQGQVMILNDSEYESTLLVTNVKIAVVAYSPFTGAKHAIGEVTFSGPYILNFGEGNNFILETMQLEGLNTWYMLHALAEGWVFDFEPAGGFGATNTLTGQDVGVLLSRINQRNARISVHYGDATTRRYGQVSVFQPGDQCLTARAMLETYVGLDNVEFDRMDDGTLVVKRINHRTNVHADRDFDALTESEQQEYGRWVVGFNYGPVNDSLTELDLETTLLGPEDKIFFYYVTAADFLEDELPPDETSPFSVANDGSALSEQLVVEGVSELDTVELEVDTTFQIEEAYTQYVDDIWNAKCGTVYNATYHGHRVAIDSLNDSYPVPDADFYGLQVKFGGLTWMSIDTLMHTESAMPEMISFRGYPYYDYVVRFLASPELLGDYPVRNLQVRNVKPRQSFYVGYTGYNLLGQTVDCRWWETAGLTRNEGEVRVWYKIDNVDGDLDTFYAVARTGIDFDDASAKRFPYAPEHLDFVDNDGDGSVDEEPSLCPESLLPYETGSCDLDDRMGWYGEDPDVSMALRTRYTSGSFGLWQNLCSSTTCSFMMPGGTDIAGVEIRTTNWGADGDPSGLNFVAKQSLLNESYDVSHEIEAEHGILTAPMESRTDGVEAWVVTPLGTVDYSTAAAEYRVYIPTSGHYVIWARVRAPDVWQDSFYVEVFDPDGDPVYIGTPSTKATFRLDVADPPIVYGLFSWTQVNNWWNLSEPVYNDVPLVYGLGSGVHTIRFTVRLLGTELEALRVEPVDCVPSDLDDDGWTPCEGDCNDKKATVNPGVAENCTTIYDDDCDGAINEGCSPKPPLPPKPVFD